MNYETTLSFAKHEFRNDPINLDRQNWKICDYIKKIK